VEALVEELVEAVIECEVEKTEKLARLAIEKGLDPLDAIERGLAKGAKAVGDKFEKHEAFLPELMMAGEAMKAGLRILEPELKRRGEKRKTLGKIVIGTVQGDIHDIGKNIVAAMMEAAGFEVYDLGVDVPCQKFIEKVKEVNADILGLSALLASTLPEQKTVMETLKKSGIKVKVMIGGAPVTESWANQIGADAYGADALDAVEKAKKLIGEIHSSFTS